jgi:hypothetical protein
MHQFLCKQWDKKHVRYAVAVFQSVLLSKPWYINEWNKIENNTSGFALVNSNMRTSCNETATRKKHIRQYVVLQFQWLPQACLVSTLTELWSIEVRWNYETCQFSEPNMPLVPYCYSVSEIQIHLFHFETITFRESKFTSNFKKKSVSVSAHYRCV